MDSQGRGTWNVKGSNETLQTGLKEINKTDRAKIYSEKDVKIKQAELARDEKLARINAEREERLATKENERKIRLQEISAARDLKLKQLDVCATLDYELQGQKVSAMKDV